MAVFFVVIAGYLYMNAGGNAEGVEKAKSIVTSSITSLVILFAAYILLRALNPQLIAFQTIQPPSVILPNATAWNPGGSGTTGTASCSAVASGVASVSALQQSCFGNNAAQASMIANKETGGNPTLPSGVDICHDQNGNILQINGQNVAASWGLFQINITANKIYSVTQGTLNCPSAFSAVYTASNHTCLVTNVPLYQQCVTAAIDSASNIQTACQLSNNGQNWKAWANECGF